MALNTITAHPGVEIIAPTVHLNGTSRESLLDDYRKATQSVIQATNVLCANAPNARDYYVQSADAYTRARAEHMARVAALARVHEELVAIYEAIEG